VPASAFVPARRDYGRTGKGRTAIQANGLKHHSPGRRPGSAPHITIHFDILLRSPEGARQQGEVVSPLQGSSPFWIPRPLGRRPRLYSPRPALSSAEWAFGLHRPSPRRSLSPRPSAPICVLCGCLLPFAVHLELGTWNLELPFPLCGLRVLCVETTRQFRANSVDTPSGPSNINPPKMKMLIPT